MNINERVKKIIFYVLISSFVIIRPAYAYLDPGTGSAILQGVLAGIAVLAIIAKTYWHKILVFLGRRKEFPEKKSGADIKPDNDVSH